MGRKSTVHKYIGKIIGGIKIIDSLNIINGRLQVKCLCIECHKNFVATFHNVYRGNYKSCGCLQFAFQNKNPRWKGYGEISKSYFNSLARGAKERNYIFSLSINYIWDLFLKQNNKCALSGVELTFSGSRKSCDYTASLDRIDNTKGYIEGNVQWVHKDINFSKQSMNNEQFLKMVFDIYKYNYE